MIELRSIMIGYLWIFRSKGELVLHKKQTNRQSLFADAVLLQFAI